MYIIDFCFAEHTERLATASKMRKQIEDTFGKMSGANDELAKLLEDEKKSELESEVKYFGQKIQFKTLPPFVQE